MRPAAPRVVAKVPFTFAHPAAVLPLVRHRGLCAVALVAGAVAPDFEYFLRFSMRSSVSHTWPGLWSFGLPVALALTALFFVVARGPLLMALPPGLRARLWSLAEPPVGWRAAVVIPASAAVGVATHLVWDGFTHAGGDFVRLFPALRQIHLHLPLFGELVLYRALQHASTLVGLAAIAVCLLAARPDPGADPRRTPGVAAVMWSTVLAGGLVVVTLHPPGAVSLATTVVRVLDGMMLGGLVASVGLRLGPWRPHVDI